MAFQYNVVPFVGQIRGGSFSNENANTVSDQLRGVINREAAAGWEFHSIAKVAIQVQPGCLGMLSGQKADYLNFDQIVFRRSV